VRLAARLPSKHFYAVQVAFGALLVYEVIGLVFSLPRSVANALGQQLEIFSLILLRGSFEELVHFEEPVGWDQFRGGIEGNPVLHLLADAVGALAVFVLLGIYYRAQRHQPISEDASDRSAFIAAKKAVALGLVASYGFIGSAGLLRVLSGGAFLFFEEFYTLLIFSDVLIVLISIRYTSTYRVVFRNSAFAVATVLIRLALAAPPYLNALMGVAAAAFAVALTLAYNASAPPIGEPGVPRR
jgi:hypothetical protein